MTVPAATVETPITTNDKVATPTVETPIVKTETTATSQELESKSLMDDAISTDKAAQAAEEKRILTSPDDKLSEEDKVKKMDLVKAQEALKQNVVPEKYEFKVPEGMTIDQEYADKASVIMKKHGITQAAATELGEMAATQIAKITASKEAADKVNFDNFVADLKKETLAALGANAQQELAFAAKTRDRLASPGLIDKLNKSGLANDIDVIRHFISIGKTISEGKLVEGKSGGVGEVDPLKTLYPTTTK